LITSEVEVTFGPRGAARTLFSCHDGEVLLSGPAGTGKSRACLEKIHLCASKYAGMRALMARKTLVSLTSTGIVTYREKVLHPLDGVAFFGGNKQEPAQFRYPNGSRVMVGGFDKASKIMSSEYDMIYIQEATELTENEWESGTTRLRNGVMPYQQLVADCNPDTPYHWLKKRCDRGATTMLESRHEDNPSVTPEYLDVLGRLTGVRLLRLSKGLWVAAEGMIYADVWDAAIHLISAIPTESTEVDRWGVPLSWTRYWVFDFGFTNPFCWQAWAEDPDGRLYRYAEIYRSQRLVEDHAADILALHGATMTPQGLEWGGSTPKPAMLICDHDAEDRATLERYLGMRTNAATKGVSAGIQATAGRMRPAGDGKSRLMLLRDALVYRDPIMVEKVKPTCTEEEIEGYVWDTTNGRKKGEEPLKQDDHGMDAMRYMVAQLERRRVAEFI
jgi:hypothetical protein